MVFSIIRDVTVLQNKNKNNDVKGILQKKKKSHLIRFLHKDQLTDPTIITGFSVLSWTGTVHSSLTLTCTSANATCTLTYPSLGFLHTSPPGPSVSHLWSSQHWHSYAGDDSNHLHEASHAEGSSPHHQLTIISLSGKATVTVRAEDSSLFGSTTHRGFKSQNLALL